MKSGETSSGEPSRGAVRRLPSSRVLQDKRENLLACVLDTVPAVLYSADGQTGELLLLEGATEALTGYTKEEFLRDSGLTGRVVHPEDRDRILCVYRHGLASGQPFELDFRVLHARDNREVWVHSRVMPIVAPDGTLLRHDGAVVDITARRRMESVLEARVEARTAELKAANEALTESEQRYRTLMENLPVGVFRTIKPRGNEVLHMNLACARMHGFDTVEEMIQHPAARLYADPADRDRLFSVLEQTGSVCGWEVKKKRNDGSPLLVSVTAHAHFDADGRMDYIDGIIEDITARKRAAEALRESEAKYRTLVENLNVCVFRSEAKPGGRIVHINPAGLRMLGFDSVEDMRDCPNEAFYVAPADRPRMMEEVRRDGFVRNWEVRTRRKDGTPLLVSITAQARRGPDGHIEYLDGIAEDLTERRRVEARVRMLSAAMEQSTEGIAMADPDGYLIFTNEAFAAMHGYEPDELRGRHLSIFHLPSQMPEVEASLAEARRSSGFRGEIWHVHRNGIVFPTLMTASTLRDAGGSILAIIGTAVDITDRKLAEEQRERLSQAIENAGEGIGTWDAHWRLTYGNTALAHIFGGEEPPDFLGRDWAAFFDDGEECKHPDITETVRAKGGWQGRLLGRRRDGQTVPLAVTLAQLGPADGDFLVVANIRDRGTEEAHLAQIRKLTTERDHSIEQERARISRELHDELGQLLTALNMNLAWFAHSAKAEPVVAGRLAEAQALVNQTLEAVRRLSTSLRPPILDNQGLLDAVRSHAAEFTQWSGVGCRVKAFPSDLEVGDPLATVVFRVVQEALTNIARHSKATRCDVSIKLVDRVLEVKIRDNGAGAVPDDLEGVQSLGIAGMRERAAAMGGLLRVENVPRGGVCVTARLPWPQDLTRDDE